MTGCNHMVLWDWPWSSFQPLVQGPSKQIHLTSGPKPLQYGKVWAKKYLV